MIPEHIDAANDLQRLTRSLVDRHCTSSGTARCMGKLVRKLTVNGRDGWIKISTEDWAKMAGTSERQAKRIRADLLSEGVIERRAGDVGRGAVGAYKLRPGGMLSWLVRLCGYRAVTRRFMGLVWDLWAWVKGRPWGAPDPAGKGDIKGDMPSVPLYKDHARTPARRLGWLFPSLQKKAAPDWAPPPISDPGYFASMEADACLEWCPS